ncbi:MAG: hypothetical protein WD876_03680 [Candidatus Pacearchaeota archaeon]
MENKKPFKCFEHHNSKQQAPFKKLSEYLIEKLPEIKIEDAKKAIIAYREYMFNLRGNKDQTSNYCDVCYKIILQEEASKTTLYDFNYCCNEHSEFRNALQLDIVRRQLGVEVEHLPMLDIYE